MKEAEQVHSSKEVVKGELQAVENECNVLKKRINQQDGVLSNDQWEAILN